MKKKRMTQAEYLRIDKVKVALIKARKTTKATVMVREL